MIVGFVSIIKRKGKVYRREHYVTVDRSHPYGKFPPCTELPKSRIRRVETVEYRPWYKLTWRTKRGKDVYYYYELSDKPDSMIKSNRGRRVGRLRLKTESKEVTISELKQNR